MGELTLIGGIKCSFRLRMRFCLMFTHAFLSICSSL